MASTSSSDRWSQVKALFQACLGHDAETRRGFLDEACAKDAELRAEVEALLAAHDSSGDFLDAPIASRLPPLPDPGLEGHTLGPYRVQGRIGQGGMGAVYLAARADDEFRKQVAIKVVRSGLNAEEILDRFRRERQTLANLDHPNIAKLLDGGTTQDGRPYFVMDYVEGLPLDEYCDRERLTITERLHLFRSACSAVQYAHQNLVVHRDLKPDNILVTSEGVPKLVDFGIAKVLSPGAASQTVYVGPERGGPMTPAYASPEQVRGEPVTTASDVYSLGVLLFELLTGRLPYSVDGRSYEALRHTVCEQEAEAPSLLVTRPWTRQERDAEGVTLDAESLAKTREGSARALRRRLAGDLDAIVLRALRKEPQARYASVEQLSEDILRHLAGRPVLAQRDAFGYRAKKFVRRHRAAVLAAAATFLVLVTAVAVTSWQARIAARERDRAQIEAAKAEQVIAFLRDTLGSADPYTEGRDVTVAQVLGEAARRIDGDLGSQPEVAAAVRSTIGNTYGNLGLYDQAESLLRASLAERRQMLGPDHRDIASTINDLAVVLISKSDHDAAESLLNEALAMYGRLGLADGREAAAVFNSLGQIENAKANGAAAESRYRRALAMLRAMPDTDREIAENLNDLAVVMQSAGRLDEAASLYREALEIIRRLRGSESPESAAISSNLAGVLASQADFGGAERLYREVLTMRRELLGDAHPEVTYTLVNYADVLERMGRYAEAIQLCDDILSRRGKTLPDLHPAVPAALVVRGRSLVGQGRPEAGEAALREALEIRRKALGDDHWLVANTESALGGCLTALRRYAEAEPLLLRSYERLRKDRGERHELSVDALGRLVRLYEAWGKPETAETFRTHLPKLSS